MSVREKEPVGDCKQALVYRLELGEDDPLAAYFDLSAEDAAAQWCEYYLRQTDSTITLVVRRHGEATIWDAWLEPVVVRKRMPK